jgi:hypothetical protein
LHPEHDNLLALSRLGNTYPAPATMLKSLLRTAVRFGAIAPFAVETRSQQIQRLARSLSFRLTPQCPWVLFKRTKYKNLKIRKALLSFN